MASSGTYAFSPSNGEIVLAAYERVDVRGPAIRSEHMLSARRELNFMFSEWSNRGVNLWELNRTQTTLTQGTATYLVPAKTIMILDSSIVLNFGQSNESRRYITPISYSEYMTYANQQTPGPPTVYFFDRLIAPTVTFWPVPDGNGPYTWDYYSYTQIQDANLASGETPDVPWRWNDALVAGLAARLAKIYPPQGAPMADRIAFEQAREKDAEKAFTIAATQDTQNVPLKFAPQITAYFPR
jgi:hypothetical protein